MAPNRAYLATYAEDILDHCQVTKPLPNGQKVWYACGQAFDTDAYNVIIRGC